MHYRARILGGILEIRSGAKTGTVVSCTIPAGRPPASTPAATDEDAHPRR
jgi:hypothetical protein